MNQEFNAFQGICLDGVNSAVRPDLIGENQVAWMMNGTVRNGKPRTRPRLIQRALLPQGRVQGAGYFSFDGGTGILMISGAMYRLLINGTSFVCESVPLGFNNAPNLPTAWMQETVGSFLIQDGQSDCIIYDGSIARRANTALNEVPIGRQMAYGNGRLFVAVGERDLKAGDITTGVSGSELKFTETNYLFGGGAFYYPNGITGLSFLPTNNTSSGYGSLMVFGRKNTDSIRAEVTDRDLWQVIPGFQTIVLDSVGAVSHQAIVKVNQDIYWRDADGAIRSLRSAAADQNSPGNSGLSREVARIVDFESDSLLDQSSGMYFDNRILFLGSPFLNGDRGVAFNKIISLDAAPLATMRGKSPPAYDGEWTGANFVRMFTGTFNGTRRGFVISSDPDGENRLWEIDPKARNDVYLTDGTGSAENVVETTCYTEFRRFDFGLPTKQKALTRIDVWPTNIEGEVNLKLQFRTDSRTQWYDVPPDDGVEFCAKMTDPEGPTPHIWKNLASQERSRLKSYSIPETIDAITKLGINVGFSFQIRLIWMGDMLVDRIDIWARSAPQPQYSNLAELDEACLQEDIQGNEITYTILP